jgi:hypothetical protein
VLIVKNYILYGGRYIDNEFSRVLRYRKPMKIASYIKPVSTSATPYPTATLMRLTRHVQEVKYGWYSLDNASSRYCVPNKQAFETNARILAASPKPVERSGHRQPIRVVLLTTGQVLLPSPLRAGIHESTNGKLLEPVIYTYSIVH